MSSSEKDLSHFREAIDPEYYTDDMFNKPHSRANSEAKKSERCLKVSSHYNDLKVTEIAQRQIANKLSKIIDSKVEFVNACQHKIIEGKVEGGVRLFSDSSSFLTCNNFEYSENRKLVQKRPIIVRSRGEKSDKKIRKMRILEATVNSEDIINGKDMKYWKSRRKPKLLFYRQIPNLNVIVEIK